MNLTIQDHLKDETLTPLMRQYWELKAQVPDALLLFRMGDFYELFSDDAIEASKILDITLTTRDKNKPKPTPMAGVPFHSIDSYLNKLLQAGKKVALGEQMEEATQGKGIVRREIVRIFTPAIQFSGENSELRYCATCEFSESKNEYTLALLEASTGDLFYHNATDFNSLFDAIQSLPIQHFILPKDKKNNETVRPLKSYFQHKVNVLWEELTNPPLSIEQSKKILSTQLGDIHPTQPFFESSSTLLALSRLVHYLLESQKTHKLYHLKMPEPLQSHTHLTLGARTIQHLDLLPNSDGSANIFQFLNKTKSSLGSRLLKKWIQNPLKNLDQIEERQSAIKSIASHIFIQKKMTESFSLLYDLERILSRVNTRLASPRDTRALGESLALIPELISALNQLHEKSTDKKSKLYTHLCDLNLLEEKLKPLYNKILLEQKEEAPLHTRDGGIFKTGVNQQLDHYIQLNEKGHHFLLEFEAKERESTGIQKLKVKFNRVFGYYIEITNGNLKNVPPHYQRKQSTVNSERFFTEALKKFEDDILQASHKQKILEQELFEALIETITTHSHSIFKAAQILAELDVLQSFSYFAQETSWCFPQLDHSFDLKIEKGRHPLVEDSLGGAYVPNTIEFSPESQLTLLVTGPNMGGKSTFMRQVAVLILLGQIGAPIPAQSAQWGVFHSLYTRLGAHDLISKGQSTFMVEMSELASILHHANERSFILLDEIGRGTSTYDGMSVAWAALEWICKKIKSRTLFATHYHELTRLSESLPLLSNVHMAVHEGQTAQELRFLYEVKNGPSHQSFGVHVAEIAGVPKPVTKRAWLLLKQLEEQSEKVSQNQASKDPAQLSLFDYTFNKNDKNTPSAQMKADTSPGLSLNIQNTPWVKEFLELDVLASSPLETLQRVQSIQKQAQSLLS